MTLLAVLGVTQALPALCGLSGAAQAAEIVLYQSALQKIVVREVFGNDGRRTLSGNPAGCSYAIVEQPATTLIDGRLHLRAYFSGRAGMRVNNACVGPGEAFWFTVSGRPAVEGDVLQLIDLQLEEGKAEYRGLLQALLQGPVANAVRINLRAELQKMLTGKAEYQATLPRLDVQRVETTSEAVTIRFDFRLEAR